MPNNQRSLRERAAEKSVDHKIVRNRLKEITNSQNSSTATLNSLNNEIKLLAKILKRRRTLTGSRVLNKENKTRVESARVRVKLLRQQGSRVASPPGQTRGASLQSAAGRWRVAGRAVTVIKPIGLAAVQSQPVENEARKAAKNLTAGAIQSILKKNTKNEERRGRARTEFNKNKYKKLIESGETISNTDRERIKLLYNNLAKELNKRNATNKAKKNEKESAEKMVVLSKHKILLPTKTWEILGLDKNTATEANVKTAYKKLSLTYHPNKKGGSDEEFTKLTRASNNAKAYIIKREQGAANATAKATTNRTAAEKAAEERGRKLAEEVKANGLAFKKTAAAAEKRAAAKAATNAAVAAKKAAVTEKKAANNAKKSQIQSELNSILENTNHTSIKNRVAGLNKNFPTWKKVSNQNKQRQLAALHLKYINNNTNFANAYNKLGFWGRRELKPENKAKFNARYNGIKANAARTTATNKAAKKAAAKAATNAAAKAATNAEAAANTRKKLNDMSKTMLSGVPKQYNNALKRAVDGLGLVSAPSGAAGKNGQAGAAGKNGQAGAAGKNGQAGPRPGFFNILFTRKPANTPNLSFKKVKYLRNKYGRLLVNTMGKPKAVPPPLGYVLTTRNGKLGYYKNKNALESQVQHMSIGPKPRPEGNYGYGPRRNNYGYGPRRNNRGGPGPGQGPGGIVFAPKINVGAARIGAQTFGGTRVGGQTMGGSRATTGNVSGSRVTTGNMGSTGGFVASAPTSGGNRSINATPEQLIRAAGGNEAIEKGVEALRQTNGNVTRAKAVSRLPMNTFTNIYALGGPVAAKKIVASRRRRRTVATKKKTKKRVAHKPRKQYIKLTPYQFKRLTDHIKKNNLRKVLIKEITH